jgi:hypothetical protein
VGGFVSDRVAKNGKPLFIYIIFSDLSQYFALFSQTMDSNMGACHITSKN